MARQASSKPADSIAHLGFGMKNGGQSSGARKTANDSPQGERGGVDQFGVPPLGNGNPLW